MGLRDQLTTAVAAMYSTDNLGVAVTYNGNPINAIISYDGDPDTDSGRGGSGNKAAFATVKVLRSDVADPGYMDKLVVDGDTWDMLRKLKTTVTSHYLRFKRSRKYAP